MNPSLDQQKLWISLGCAVISAIAHWASTQTSDKPMTLRQLRGQLVGAFITGAAVSEALDLQPWLKIDALPAFIASGAVGFVYGPTALVIAARRAGKQYGFDPPPGSPPDPPILPPPGGET